MLEVQLSFDYAALDDDTRLTVETHTEALKGLIKKTAAQIWEIGDRLLQVKSALEHGQFQGWLEAEFDWSYRSAQRFMSVATKFKSDTVSLLTIAPTALYQLASDETPDSVREFVLERAANGQSIKKADVEEAIAAVQPTFQIGDWVSGINYKSGKVVEGAISSIGNKYLVLKGGISILSGTATILKPAPTTLKAGDLVAGFYNPTSREEVGTLERDPGGHYSLIITAQGDRCGVVTVTLRAATEEESELFYSAVEASEPSIDAEDESAFKKGDRVRGITANSKEVEGIVDVVGEGCIRLDSEAVIAKRTAELLERAPEVSDPKFKKGDRVTGEFSVSKELITGEVIGELGDRRNGSVTTVRADDGRVWGLTTDSLKPADAPAPAAQTDFIASRSGSDEHYTPDWVWKPALQVIDGDQFALDPASNSHHSPNVPAQNVYTIDDDGLAHDWTTADSIWINPPFSLIDEFVVKADLEAQGHLFVLAKCDCRPAWFSKLCDLCCAFVLIHKSVKFLGNENSSFFGVAIFYRGPDPDRFFRAYQPLGTVCMPVIPELLAE